MEIYNPHTKKKVNLAMLAQKDQLVFASTHDETILSWLEENGLHASLIEDIQSEDQSITFDELENTRLKIMKYLLPNSVDAKLTDSHNVSILFFKQNLFIIATDERVMERIKHTYLSHKDARSHPAYLLYLFPDIIIDNNTAMLDGIEEKLETLEEHIFHAKAQESELHQDIYYIRRTLDKILKIATQEKDSIRKGYDHLPEEKKQALQYEYLDIKEHIRYLIIESKTLLDRSEYLLTLYTGILSTRMNKAMQKLAAISLIFLPLTFIAGIYGMNFMHMPELKWLYGYGFIWAVFISIAGVIFFKLKKMKWL